VKFAQVIKFFVLCFVYIIHADFSDEEQKPSLV